METKNLEWIRTFGNHLMGEFEEVLYQLEGACQKAGIDLQNDGEKGRAAGISKYGFLEKSNVLLENLKEDYLNFAQVLGFDANTGGWDLPSCGCCRSAPGTATWRCIWICRKFPACARPI